MRAGQHRLLLIIAILLAGAKGWSDDHEAVAPSPSATDGEQRDDNEDDDEHLGIEAFVEELFLGESPFPQERGEWQTTLSLSHFQGGENLRDTGVGLAIEYGITDRFQIGIEISYHFLRLRDEDEDEDEAPLFVELAEAFEALGGEEEDDGTPLSELTEAVETLLEAHAGEDGVDVDGFGDLELGLLYNFIRRENFLASFAFDVTLPTADEDKDLGEGVFEFEPSLRFGAQSGRAQYYFGIGGEFSEDESAFTYLAALAYECEHVVPMLEWTGATGGEASTSFLTPGMVLRLPHEIELSMSVPIGLTSESEDWGAMLALTTEF